MIEFVEIDEPFGLRDYEEIAMLAHSVHELRLEAGVLLPQLRDRTIWMVNSTRRGGGVAEMLPKVVALLRELGARVNWVVIGSDDRPEFFTLTKHLHNLIHGEGEPRLTSADRQLYDEVSRRNAIELEPHLKPDDILVIHDPQPLAMGALLKSRLGLRTIWRCHIGLDEQVEQTRTAWEFLRPYASSYDRAVFSAPEYIPDYLAGQSTVIHPAIDPFSHKNRPLTPHKLVGILCNSGLKQESQPVLTPPFHAQARRLHADGRFLPTTGMESVGLLYRPLVTQISRWDRLKGFRALMEAFVRLKSRLDDKTDIAGRHRRRLEIVRLVLAGPDPASIQDDPEGQEVLDDLCNFYCSLAPRFQSDVALLTLPMESRKENALMVNALQCCSTVVVQNSLREGFGLTVTEAMWKQVPVVGTRTCGIRQQIRHGVDGLLVDDPSSADEIARTVDQMLEDVMGRDRMGRAAQRRTLDAFLIFTQLCNWLRVLAECASAAARSGTAPHS